MMSAMGDAVANLETEVNALDGRVVDLKSKLEDAEKKVVDVPTPEEVAKVVDLTAKLKGIAV